MNGGKAKTRLILLGGLAAALAVTAALAFWMAQSTRVGGGSVDERPLEGLQTFGIVPPFSLTERSGRQVTPEDLTGKVWIVNFFYTHCPDTCPLQSAQIAKLQADFAEEKDLRLISITVDPERDTPAVLREYADRFGADPARWLFLTGEKEAIYWLAREGFRLGAGVPEEQAQGPGIRRRRQLGGFLAQVPAWAHEEDFGQGLIPHSSRFVLVDREARIRGYYQSSNEEALQRLRRDVRTLLRSNEP